MPTIVLFNDALNPTDYKIHSVDECLTVNDALQHHNLIEQIHSQPYLVHLNDQFVLNDTVEGAASFSSQLQTNDVISLCPVVSSGAFNFLLNNWLIVINAVTSLLNLQGVNPTDLPNSAIGEEPSSTYNVSSRGNRIRFGQPKPRVYGTMRVWPDLGATSFTEYENGDDQVIYELFEISLGNVDVDINSARYDNTPVGSLADFEYEIIPPGSNSMLFPAAVVTSTEVSNLNLESQQLGDYVVNGQGTKISRIVCDVVAQAGIYRTNNSGTPRQYSVDFKFEARLIDDNDQPLNNWFDLGTETFTGDNRDAIRRTFNYVVEPGRYQVRMTRLTPEQDELRYSDNLVWSQLKGFLVDGNPPTNTTRLAVKIRASEQLGNNALSKFNVVVNARIATWHPQNGYTENVLTNNPVWAFIDVARSQYGGKRSDAYIDLNQLYEFALFCDEQGFEFNGVFDTQSTVWDALTKIAACCRASPVDRAGVYTMVYDGYNPQPTAMFTQRNIVRNSLKINHSIIEDQTADAVIIRYFDRDHNYIQQEVLCALPGSQALNPSRIDAFGITSREQAYLYGIYIVAVNQYRRETITFETGLSGIIPFYHDVVAVSHYMFSAQGPEQISGDVISWNGVDELTLTENIPDLTNPFIVIRNTDGTPGELIPVVKTARNRVRLTNPQLLDQTAMEWRGDRNIRRPMFALGEGVEFIYRVKVERITPQQGNRYRLQGFVDDQDVYIAADGLQVPPINQVPDVNIVAPVVESLTAVVTGTEESPVVHLNWQGRNADRYIIQVSTDGGNVFNDLGLGYTTQPEYTARPNPELVNDDIYIYRVAGQNIFRGNFAQVIVDISDSLNQPPPAPTNLQLSEVFTGPFLRVQWESFTVNHRVVLSVNGVQKFAQNNVQGNTFEIHGNTAQDFGVGRRFTVEVFAIDGEGRISETAATLAVFNPPPAQLNNLVVEGLTGQALVRFDQPADTDITGISVWVSTVDGFTPNNANLVVNRSRDPVIGVPLEESQTYYVRVAAVDVWGDTELNFSGQFTVTPTTVDTSAIEAELVRLDGKFPLASEDISEEAILTTHLTADLIYSQHIVSQQITGGHVQFLTLEGGHLRANTITADKMFISELSALTSNIGLITAGTVQTTSGTGLRVRISSSGNYPIWIGTGSAVTDANGLFYLNSSSNQLVFKGQLDIRSATTGARLEITNDQIRVFDNANTLRVKIGNLA